MNDTEDSPTVFAVASTRSELFDEESDDESCVGQRLAQRVLQLQSALRDVREEIWPREVQAEFQVTASQPVQKKECVCCVFIGPDSAIDIFVLPA